MDTGLIEQIIARVSDCDEAPDTLAFMARVCHLDKVVIGQRCNGCTHRLTRVTI